MIGGNPYSRLFGLWSFWTSGFAHEREQRLWPLPRYGFIVGGGCSAVRVTAQGVLSEAQFGPRWSQLGPRWPQLDPRWSQLDPRWSQLGPRWSQLGPRWSQLDPRWSQLGARLSQLGPRWSQLDPRWSWLDPRWSELGPRWSQLGPWTSLLLFGKLWRYLRLFLVACLCCKVFLSSKSTFWKL
jgi:hypothetical protein